MDWDQLDFVRRADEWLALVFILFLVILAALSLEKKG
jgi:hypothetical protein